MRKLSKLLAIFLAFALFAVACGDDDGDDSASTVDTSAVDAARAEAEAAKADAEAALADAEAAKAEAEAAAEAQAAAEAEADAASAAIADAEAAASAASAEADAARAEAEAAAAAIGQFQGEVIRITGPERSPEEAGSIVAAVEPFEEATGAIVVYTPSADWEADINVQIAAGNPPDISIVPQPGKLANLARAGFVAPLAQETIDVINANWPEGSSGFGNIDGVQYGVPNKSDLKSIVWYRPSIFEAGGYDVPTTWDELTALDDQMIADGQTPWCIGIASGQATGWVFTDWTEDLMLRLEGPEAYDQWVTNELKFSDERVVGIFDEILTLWNTPGAVFAAGGSISASHHSSDPAEGLANGDCAMVRQASFFSGFYDGDFADLDWFYFPAVDPSTAPVLVGGTLAAAFNDRPAVQALLTYFATPEYANARQVATLELKGGGEGTLSGFNTANTNADRSLWAPLEQTFIEIMQSAAVVRFDGADLMPADVGAGSFWTEATAMTNGEKTAAEAAAALDESWAAIGADDG